MKNCTAISTATDLKFHELSTHLKQHSRAALYRDVLHVKHERGNIFIFPYGVITTWDISQEEVKNFLADIRRFEEQEIEFTIQHDKFSFTENNDTMAIRNDHIFLKTTDPLEKLAVSHAIAQSLKLAQLETMVQNRIENTRYIPRELAQSGATKMSHRDLAKLRGELFLEKSYINLHYDLLDTPEFFWEYPDLEPVYQPVAQYLDNAARVEILNKKLEVINELLSMLADEQHHKKAARLEWIIIILIAIEIIIFIPYELLLF